MAVGSEPKTELAPQAESAAEAGVPPKAEDTPAVVKEVRPADVLKSIAISPTGMTPPAPEQPIAVPASPAGVEGVVVEGKHAPYRPHVFSPHQYQTLTLLSEMILQNNDLRGAHEARVNEFIDFQLRDDPDLKSRFNAGLKWLDTHARRLYGKTFMKLKESQQQDIILALDVKALHRPGEEQGREFFELARRYTYMGFYTSEEALKSLVPRNTPTKAEKAASKVRRMARTADDQG